MCIRVVFKSPSLIPSGVETLSDKCFGRLLLIRMELGGLVVEFVGSVVDDVFVESEVVRDGVVVPKKMYGVSGNLEAILRVVKDMVVLIRHDDTLEDVYKRYHDRYGCIQGLTDRDEVVVRKIVKYRLG